MKVVFLDIDGVLNNISLLYHYGFDYIDRDMVVLFANIIKRTGAKIVLSSTWRLDDTSREIVSRILADYGLDVFDKTPKIEGSPRSEEISSWLDEHPDVLRYAILDDNSDAGIGMEGSFFKTDAENGLDSDTAERITAHLGVKKG